MAMKTFDSQAPLSCDSDAIARLIRDEDIEALDHMSRCFGERLLKVGRKYCRNPEEAQDAVQDALLLAGEHLGSYRGEGSPEKWLMRMVINACSRMRRGRKNDPNLHAIDTEVADSSQSPENQANIGETAQALGRSLLNLSPKDRSIVLLADVEGWTGPEIAAKTGMTAGAVRTRLSRARAQLRDELKELL
jgi:RNA polymerase sigma-70 factor, ECF subfamily